VNAILNAREASNEDLIKFNFILINI
jgi:hypothetical protein